MNKTLTGYIKSLSENDLYSLLELIVNEINKRKEKGVNEASSSSNEITPPDVKGGKEQC